MRTREEFHAKLVEALGSENAFFQPPENLKLPSGNRIVYTRDSFEPEFADDIRYINHTRYTVTLISKDPDWSLITELPFLFMYCSLDRSFSTDGLNHNVYTIFD